MIAKYNKSVDKIPESIYFPVTEELAFTFKKNGSVVGLIHLYNSKITGELSDEIYWMGLDTKETGISISTFEIFEEYRGNGYGKEMLKALFDYYPEATFVTAYANEECLPFWEKFSGYEFILEDEGYYYFNIYKSKTS